MENNKDASVDRQSTLANYFSDTIKCIYYAIGENAFRLSKNLNAAVFDSVMIGVANRLKKDTCINSLKLQEAYQKLIEDPEYRKFVESNTASEVSLKGRINMAIKVFDEI